MVVLAKFSNNIVSVFPITLYVCTHYSSFQQLTTVLLYMTISWLGTATANEVCYFITSNCTDQCSNAESIDTGNYLTLPQFVKNSTAYLANHTILIFLPGNHGFESDLIVENIKSFSMSVWPASSPKVVINCNHSARFEFRNISTVTMTGLEFVGCFNNHIEFIGQFQLEGSSFIGSEQPIARSTVFLIVSCTANLDRITMAFMTQREGSENCTSNTGMVGILLRKSVIEIRQSRFEGNKICFGVLIYDEFGSTITIVNTTFINNSASDSSNCNTTGSIVYVNNNRSTINIFDSKFEQNVGVLILGDNCKMFITHTHFIDNEYSGSLAVIYATNTDLVISYSMFTESKGSIIEARHTNTIKVTEWTSQAGDTTLSIRYTGFISNHGALVTSIGKMIVSIDHSTFIDNIGSWILDTSDTIIASVTHNKFVNNTVRVLPDATTTHESLVRLGTDTTTTVSFNEFIANKAGGALVHTKYYTTARNVTNNVFADNSAEYEIFIAPFCRPGLSLSLGNSRCIQCSENWLQDLMGIVAAAFIAGIVLVIFMLALNMTVAVGSLNGILFFAHIVGNSSTYFLPFTTPNFATVFISWLNLGVGFDICFYQTIPLKLAIAAQLYKVLLESVFPAYVIILVIIVIVASERSSKFAKIIGKGNPVAVLATMILLSYARFLKVVITSLSLLYGQPAYGSRNVDTTKVESILTVVTEPELLVVSSFLAVIFIPLFLLCVIYTTLLFSWQWLLRYQDKAIFKWVRYQKLHHFLEPYHAPYTVKHRYWTGLLFFVRLLLYVISILNFSLDQRVYLLSVILVVGGLILLKGVSVERVYKNWPLDVMETAIYFNLVAFSTLTWYNLDSGEDKTAIAYTSIMIIFIFLLGIIVFHILRYTWIHKCSFIERIFNWTSSKLIEKRSKQGVPSDGPEVLDGYQLRRRRSTAGKQQQSTITQTVIDIPN